MESGFADVGVFLKFGCDRCDQNRFPSGDVHQVTGACRIYACVSAC